MKFLLLSLLLVATVNAGGFDRCFDLRDSSSSSSSSSSSEEDDQFGFLAFLVPQDVEDPNCGSDILIDDNRVFGDFEDICARAAELEIDLEEVRMCKPTRSAVREAKDDGDDEDSPFRRRDRPRHRNRRRRGGKHGRLTEEQADSIPLEEGNFKGKCVKCPEPEVPLEDDENNETEDF